MNSPFSIYLSKEINHFEPFGRVGFSIFPIHSKMTYFGLTYSSQFNHHSHGQTKKVSSLMNMQQRVLNTRQRCMGGLQPGAVLEVLHSNTEESVNDLLSFNGLCRLDPRMVYYVSDDFGRTELLPNLANCSKLVERISRWTMLTSYSRVFGQFFGGLS